MGISRDSAHKRRASGGKKKAIRMKRKFELGRPAAMTRIGSKNVHKVRVRGGHTKFRALRLDTGNFSWGSESVTRKCRILLVVYNASNNELVRTNTLVKNCIIQIDASPFKHWYESHYNVTIGKKSVTPATSDAKKSDHVVRTLRSRNNNRTLDPHLLQQFGQGRLYACISSRPGQCGRADGYVLEGRELDFYVRKLKNKKGGK